MDDTRRYCLPCSDKTGKLVQRVCPALESVRERRAAQHKVKRERAAARVVAREKALDPYGIRGWFKRLQKLMAFSHGHWRRELGFRDFNRWKHVTIDLRAGHGGGRAWDGHHILVNTRHSEADQIGILVHEMAHIVNYWRGGRGHDDSWRSIFAAAMLDLTGETVEFSTGHRYSDNGNMLIERWLDEKRSGDKS